MSIVKNCFVDNRLAQFAEYWFNWTNWDFWINLLEKKLIPAQIRYSHWEREGAEIDRREFDEGLRLRWTAEWSGLRDGAVAADTKYNSANGESLKIYRGTKIRGAYSLLSLTVVTSQYSCIGNMKMLGGARSCFWLWHDIKKYKCTLKLSSILNEK